MNDLAIKISKKTKDINSIITTDFIFNSNNPTLSIKQMGNASLTTTVNEYNEPIVATRTIPHNFGYKPQFVAFTTLYASQMLSKFVFDIVDYVNLDLSVSYADVGGNITEDVRAYVTNTDLIIEATIYSWSPYFSGSIGIEYTYNVDYILFMEEAKRIT